MYAAFPRSEYYQRVRLPPVHLSSSGWSIRSAYSAPIQAGQDNGGSPRFHDASVSVRAVLSDPAGVSSDHRPWRSPTVAFQVFDPVGLRMCNEAQSLHLRYGPDIALSTLNSCCYLHEPKTRFPVGRLITLAGAGISPAGSARLILAHQKIQVNLYPTCALQPQRTTSFGPAHQPDRQGRGKRFPPSHLIVPVSSRLFCLFLWHTSKVRKKLRRPILGVIIFFRKLFVFYFKRVGPENISGFDINKRCKGIKPRDTPVRIRSHPQCQCCGQCTCRRSLCT